MEKLDLEAKIKECFEYNKGVNKIYVVEDGTCFLEKAKEHAKNYAHSKGLKLELVTRDEKIEETEESAPKTGTAEQPAKNKEVKKTSKIKILKSK